MAKIRVKMICPGWADEKGRVHPCGRYIGYYEQEYDPKIEYPPDPTSHTYCPDCARKQTESYQRGQA